MSDVQTDSAGSSAEKTAKLFVPQIEPVHLLGLFERKSKDIDLNNDGLISKNELQLAAQSQNLTPSEGLMVASLVKNFDYLIKCHFAVSPERRDKISLSDMREFHALASQANQAILNARDVLNEFDTDKFDVIDKDCNRFLSQIELKNYGSSTNNDLHKGLCSFLGASFIDVQGASNDEWGLENNGLSRADFRKYKSKMEKASPDAIRFGDELAIGRANLQAVNPQLYKDMNAKEKSVTADAIKPGSLFNSKFETWLRKTAQEQPEYIVQSIVQNNDGTFTVELPDYERKVDTFNGAIRLNRTNDTRKVDVPAPTTAELSMYSLGSDQGIWPAVYAKAWGRYIDRLHVETAHIHGVPPLFKSRTYEQDFMDLLEGRFRGATATYGPTKMSIESVKNFDTKIKLGMAGTAGPKPPEPKPHLGEFFENRKHSYNLEWETNNEN